MSKFESMSNEELGGLVTGEFYDCKEWALSDDGKTAYHCGPDGSGWAEQKIVDINSWADMGPILTEHKIGLHPNDDGTYKAFTTDGGFDWSYLLERNDKNPLRAAAIIYLESLESNNGSN